MVVPVKKFGSILIFLSLWFRLRDGREMMVFKSVSIVCVWERERERERKGEKSFNRPSPNLAI
jgi:hypothetical protein